MLFFTIICLNLLAILFFSYLLKSQRIILLVYLIAHAFLMKTFIVQAFNIPAKSMKPTMLVGDHILTNKYIYNFTDPKRGDIVIFPLPEDPSKIFIKRIIGMDGDTIEIRDKQVFINDEPYHEEYKVNNDPKIYSSNIQPRDNLGPITIPDNSLFLMGDNRDFSYDSRYWGFIKKPSLKGKAVTIYWSWDKEDNTVRWNRVGKGIR